MYRGEIPGFYWDSVKAKYFKIQANHIAPANSQYAQSNVNQERREYKRRKTRESHIKLLTKQTVTSAPSLRHSFLGGSGLLREHGGRPYSTSESQRESAFIQGFQNSQIIADDPTDLESRITDAHHISETSQWLVAMSHNAGSHAFYLCDRNPESLGSERLSGTKGLHAFYTPISHVSCANVHGAQLAIAFTSETSFTMGNLFVADISSPYAEGLIRTAYSVNIGDASKCDQIWDCKFNHYTNQIAFAGTSGCGVHNLEDRHIKRLGDDSTNGASASEWLDPHTVAIGMRLEMQTMSQKMYWDDVYLWDIRSDGVSLRISRKDRINGLHSPHVDGHSLLVGSAHEIALYDLRMLGQAPDLNDGGAMEKLRGQPALLSIPHTSQTPRLDLATYGGSCVAAVDYENKLQVYSLRTGKQLRTFGLPPGTTGLMARPKWQEDKRGSPFLQVCAGNTIQRWSWGGMDA